MSMSKRTGHAVRNILKDGLQSSTFAIVVASELFVLWMPRGYNRFRTAFRNAFAESNAVPVTISATGRVSYDGGQIGQLANFAGNVPDIMKGQKAYPLTLTSEDQLGNPTSNPNSRALVGLLVDSKLEGDTEATAAVQEFMLTAYPDDFATKRKKFVATSPSGTFVLDAVEAFFDTDETVDVETGEITEAELDPETAA